MSISIVNDIVPRQQYIASAGETVFSYNFGIFEDGDLDVYLTPAGQTPNADTDILVLNVDYTVSGAGDPDGGFITLTTPALVNDIVTIVRDVPMQRLIDYTTGGPFTAASINDDLDRVIMMIQQVMAALTTRGLLYNVNDELTSGQTTLPQLAAANNNIPIWSTDTEGNLIATALEENPDVSTLRAELASETEANPGSGLVGHYSLANGQTTVNAELQSIQTEITNIETDIINIPPHSLQRFTASGSFTVPDNITLVWVTLVAGGGGGGGSSASVSGGGGGGGQVYRRSPVTVTPSQVIAITIGLGGAGGSADANGTSGGVSSFGALLSASGGQFGYGGTPGASGGIAGGPGGGDGEYGGSTKDVGGSGGPSLGGATFNPAGVNGTNGVAYGSGGSGGGCYGGAHAGGDGANGFCVVEW
jgi:hypothetical protein